MITVLTYAAAPGEPFASLNNTDWVVLLGFVVFIAILMYFKVPALITGQLDKRSERIRAELDEARALREEAQTILASYERKQKEVADQASEIIAGAKAGAEAASEQAKADLEAMIERRLQAATDQIASAEAAAVREVKDRAATVAIAAASKVLAERLSGERGEEMIDTAIEQVGQRLN